MTRGQLRVYLGAAPGVGKTYKMLEEGRRRQQRGTDVVVGFVGFVETHGRPVTEGMLGSLELMPRKEMDYRGSAFTEMDLDAVLARAPEVALVDELAHTNVPGSPHFKRWQDVEALLDAGITVLTTVNIQHLESLNDVVAEITGVLLRRGARVAAAAPRAPTCWPCTSGTTTAWPGPTRPTLAHQRVLVESLGCTYHQVVGGDIPAALLDFARAVNGTQVVLGASRRGRFAQLFARGVGVTTTEGSGSIDVHLVTHEEVKRGRTRIRLTRGVTVRRRVTGFTLAAIGLPLLTLVLDLGSTTLTTDLLLFRW